LPQQTRNGAAQVAEQLARAGVTTLFGVMGDGNVDVIAAAIGPCGLRYIGARHEQGAVSMAEGYAHATGNVGVATVTYGPGVGNTITALTTAARHASQVLMICGHRTSRHGPPQFHDPDAMLAGTDVTLMRIDDPADLPGCVAHALTRIREAPGPVVLSIADLVLEGAAAPDAAPRTASPPAGSAPGAPRPSPETIAAIAERLLSAERPLILAGRGARRDGAGAILAALADRLGAAAMTTLLGNGLFGDHPNALGISGGLSTPLGRRAAREADATLVLGASLNGWTTEAGRAFAPGYVMHVDADPRAFDGAFIRPDLQVVADAGAVTAALLEALSARVQEARQDRQWWAPLAAEEGAAAPLDLAGGLNPGALCRSLDAALPKERALAIDGGHFFEPLCREIRVPDARAFHWTLGFGSIGLGLATAIGAAIGRPDRLTVAGLGDGGLLMSLGELETVARYALPILVLVMNDAAYGAEVKLLEAKGWDAAVARFPETDFAAIARALGIESATLRTATDVAAVMPRLAALRRPFLLDARIDQSETAEFIGLLHDMKAAAAAQGEAGSKPGRGSRPIRACDSPPSTVRSWPVM
jgi:acetolactate synthase-1/2/3 large subunit